MTLRFLKANMIDYYRILSPFELSRGDIVAIKNDLFIVREIKSITQKAVTLYSSPLFADGTIASMYNDRRVLRGDTLCKFYGKGVV